MSWPSAVNVPVSVPSTTRAANSPVIYPVRTPAVKLNRTLLKTIPPSSVRFQVPSAGALLRPSIRVKTPPLAEAVECVERRWARLGHLDRDVQLPSTLPSSSALEASGG